MTTAHINIRTDRELKAKAQAVLADLMISICWEKIGVNQLDLRHPCSISSQEVSL